MLMFQVFYSIETFQALGFYNSFAWFKMILLYMTLGLIAAPQCILCLKPAFMTQDVEKPQNDWRAIWSFGYVHWPHYKEHPRLDMEQQRGLGCCALHLKPWALKVYPKLLFEENRSNIHGNNAGSVPHR